MGVRSATKKELMGLGNTNLLTADDVRAHLGQKIKEDAERGFAVISKFNDLHSKLQSGDGKIGLLEFERHRLFKEVLYKRESVDAWLNNVS